MIRNLNNLEMLDLLMKDDYNGFSREGSEAIIEYLEEWEEMEDSEIELDLVKIRTNFTEIEGIIEEVEEERENNFSIDCEIIEVEEEENYLKIIIFDYIEPFYFYKRVQ